MTPDDFAFLQQLLKERSGIVLSSDKGYLVENRLMPVARERRVATLKDLIALLRGPRDEDLLTEVTDALTTNDTHFFRDRTPFAFLAAYLQNIAPVRKAEGASAIRIWCAACSSGQEAYSLAMMAGEMSSLFDGMRLEILATDLSSNMVRKARAGLYTQFEVQHGLPARQLVRHFENAGDMWQLSTELRGQVDFQQYNLLWDFRQLGQFDAVLCRNVFSGFDQPTRNDVIGRLSAIIPSDGVLVLGNAESLMGVTDAFAPAGEVRGVYKPAAAAADVRGAA